jgi:hypothetical protein
VSGIAHFLFLGGDPAVDLPRVSLERRAESGAWQSVLLPSGRLLTDRGVEMILSHTPDPLHADAGAARDFYWLVEWQAVTHHPSLDHVGGLPEGEYRLVARGRCADPSEREPPFAGTPYEVASDPFRVTGRGALAVRVVERDGTRVRLGASYHENGRGFRLLHPRSESVTATPLAGGGAPPAVTVEVAAADRPAVLLERFSGVPATETGDESLVEVNLSSPVSSPTLLRVLDAFGSSGEVVVAP